MSPEQEKQRKRFARSRCIRGFGVFRASPPLHFYLAQFVIFAYVLHRFASRNYTVYGYFSEEMFDYPFAFMAELWPVQLFEILSFQFIYRFLPHPPAETLFVLQWAIIACCGAGLLGVFPRLCAGICFVIGTHLTGLMQSSNAPVDGGTVTLCALLVLALAPKRSFYTIGRRFDLSRRDARFHWPIFLLMLVVGAFYTSSGICKIVDVGPHWPFVVHLDHLACHGIEQSLFVSSRYVDPFVCTLNDAYWTSVLGGWVSLIGELGFIAVLFLPRFRLFLVTSMVAMHVLVLQMAGINFVGSSAILLLCLDWNVLARRATVYYDDRSASTTRRVDRLRRRDWLHRLRWIGLSSLDSGGGDRHPSELDRSLALAEVGVVDELGDTFYGAEAFDQMWCRIPLWFPAAVMMRVPGVMPLARLVERRRAGNQQRPRRDAAGAAGER